MLFHGWWRWLGEDDGNVTTLNLYVVDATFGKQSPKTLV
jgi:hypothetical protein